MRCHYCSHPRKSIKRSTISWPALGQNMVLASGNQDLESSIRYYCCLDAEITVIKATVILAR